MDKISAQLNSARKQFQQNGNVYWVPIRHHSPACSHYLIQLLNQYQPDVILIEGSIDFNSQLASLSHVETKPPVALYSAHSFYPMCDTSPEWQAIKWGAEKNKSIQFIDLPINDKSWAHEKEHLSSISYLHEANLQHSEFVQKLVKKTGCRNSDELWERQFELRSFNSAEKFFLCVFEYCISARLTYSEQALIDSGDVAREKHMRAQIEKHAKTGKKCVVITGGFHTAALLNFSTSDHNGTKNKNDNTITPPEPSWLIRYSLDRLDANTGYSAGMQAPAFYQRLYQHRKNKTLSALAQEFLLESLACLANNNEYSITINTPAKRVICEQALHLAILRGHTCPGLHDLKDALQSVLIKRELTEYEFILSHAHKILAGNTLGQVSIEQPPLPLVNELYQRLKKLRFKLDSTNKVTTTFSLYNAKEKMHDRLALLNQCAYLELGFANKTSGPDWFYGHKLQLQNEEWQYAWTPWVEAKLVDLSLYAADWESLLAHQIALHESEIKHKGLIEAQQFFVQLVLMNCLDLAPQFWSFFESIVADSTDNNQLSKLLHLLLRLNQRELAFFEHHHSNVKDLIAKAWSQLMYSLPSINQQPFDEALHTLMNIQALTQEFEGYLADSWEAAWISRLEWMIEFGEYRAGLLYACRALKAELTATDEDELLQDLKILFQLDTDEAYEALAAIIKVMPHWLLNKQKSNVMALLNDLIAQWSEERFLAALPELRFLFSHLDPQKIESLSTQVCLLNNWDIELDVFESTVNEHDVIQAQRLYQMLQDDLNKRGLEHWIKH